MATAPAAQVEESKQGTKPRKKTAEKPGPQPAIDVAVTAPLAVVAPQSSLLGPVGSVEEAKTKWDEYVKLCREILDPDTDYVYFACATKPDGWPVKPMGFRTRAAAEIQCNVWTKQNFRDVYVKESKKRSAWDKLARFYGISTPIESQVLCATADAVVVGEYIIEKLIGDSFKIFSYQDSATLTIRKVTVLLRVVAPNGRTILGDGACSVSERSKGAESFSHPDHDIFSTAFTRAFNRGVSRCIGTGEVSAEEFEAADTNGSSAAVTIDTSGATHKASNGTIETSQVSSEQRPTATERTVSQPPTAASGTSTATPQCAPVADNNGVPRAETPDYEKWLQPGGGPQGTLTQPSAEAQPNAPKFSDRFASLQEKVFGDKHAADRLLCYLFFALPDSRPVDIESNGRWDQKKWNAAMKNLWDRTERLTLMEQALADMGLENFLKWAKACVGSAKNKKIFVSQ